ncbi:MAG: type VI secretion system-associated FHA domain protein TagH [Methylococcaceae bacterium]|nr:type VI secretion system-associated FHA domain protein TagH [Methylococcaceae bacterium]
MPLTLKIVSFEGQPYIAGDDVVVDEQGGSIGRSDANSLMLADDKKMISRRHATIEFEDGCYMLNDSSLAGTFIDEAVEPINNTSVQLLDGMQLGIGDYTIVCSISEDATPFAPQDPFLNTHGDEAFAIQDENNGLLNTVEDQFESPFLSGEDGHDFSNELLASVTTDEEVDLLHDAENNSLLDQVAPAFNEASPFSDNGLLDSIAEESTPEQGLMVENLSSLNDSFVPSEPVKQAPETGQGDIPADFNFEDFFNLNEDKSSAVPKIVNDEPAEVMLADRVNSSLLTPDDVPDIREHKQVEPITQTAPPAEQTPASDNNLLQAFLQGAQIESQGINLTNPDEKMTRIGTMFRHFVESTVAVLRSRAEFKSLFRVTVTTIKRADNNPLKFSVTTDEAIKHLINDGQGGFKKSVESIDEGFNDLLNHQLAMQAGIQASLHEMLKQFDPAVIEKQYEEGIVLQKKSKCWEKYTKVYQQQSETAVDDFFGDAFSDAYEKQMKQLKK